MSKIINQLPYILFELANSHGGSVDALFKNIEAYSEIDYVRKGIKFQVIDPDLISLPDFEWYSVYKKLYFSISIWERVINDSSSLGDVWIDVFDRYGVDVIKSNLGKIHGFKLQASVLENYEVYQELLEVDLSSKKLIVNISGFELGSIDKIIERLSKLSENIILQMGFQSYPTSIEDTALQKIAVLRAAYPNLSLSLADHASATDEFALSVPVYANLMGCEYIEKHFCFNRTEAVYDEYSAIEPNQMRSLCKIITDAKIARSGGFIVKSEEEYLEKTVQIPIINHPISKGKLLSLSDIKFRRTSQDGLTWQQILNHQMSGNILSVGLVSDKTIQDSCFQKAKVAVVVAGRMKSTRLLRKALLPIGEIPSVERCLSQCLALKGVDDVILATSTLEEDAILSKYLVGEQALLWKGDPDDVISRYLGACDHYNIDVVIRVTADCPFVLPEIMEILLKSHFETGADYTVANEFAVGTSAEIMNVEALKTIKSHFEVAEYSEYMTWYFQNNPDYFKLNYVSLPDELVRNYRITLDYPEDLSMFESVIQKCKDKSKIVSANELFKILDDNSHIAQINGHLDLKYKTDNKLIKELNDKTRIKSV